MTTAKTQQWDKKDEWRKRGQDFMVTVSRHNSEPLDCDEGVNCWAVYAYIYPKHPHFANFDGANQWQDATSVMPLHGGASLLNYPMYDNKVTSVKVGADYHYLRDNFTHYATQDDASEVFADADRLFDWLDARSAKASGGAA